MGPVVMMYNLDKVRAFEEITRELPFLKKIK